MIIIKFTTGTKIILIRLYNIIVFINVNRNGIKNEKKINYCITYFIKYIFNK